MAGTTRRMVETYSACEGWKADHEDVQNCWAVEDLLNTGVFLHGLIEQAELRLHETGPGRSMEDLEACVAEIDDIRLLWLKASRVWITQAERVVAKGYEVEGLDRFRVLVEDATISAENAELEKGLPPLDVMLAHLSPDNPRPERYTD